MGPSSVNQTRWDIHRIRVSRWRARPAGSSDVHKREAEAAKLLVAWLEKDRRVSNTEKFLQF